MSSIERVIGRQVWDSRGRPTVEAEVHLAGGATGRAIAPSGASTGSAEALDLRDGGKRLKGFGVNQAVANVNQPIQALLKGMNALDQQAIDQALIAADGTPQKTHFGGNACVAVSSAVAWAAAAAQGIPLWQHLAALSGHGANPPALPVPMIQIFGGGAHAGGRIDIQDFLVICRGADSFAQAVEWTAEIYLAAQAIMKAKGKLAGVCDEGGLWPDFERNEDGLELLTQAIEQAGLKAGTEVGIALDVAASEFLQDGKYHFRCENRSLSAQELIALQIEWCQRYPIISLEDPLAETDREGFIAITEALGNRVQIVGDDFLTTNAARVRAAAEVGAGNAVLLKSNQCGTLSELIEACLTAKSFGWNTVVSGRSGESEDTTLSHLAFGLDGGQIKVGSITRSERNCKWNEVIRLEESLGTAAHLWRFAPPQARPREHAD